jgi:hypothetical protein
MRVALRIRLAALDHPNCPPHRCRCPCCIFHRFAGCQREGEKSLYIEQDRVTGQGGLNMRRSRGLTNARGQEGHSLNMIQRANTSPSHDDQTQMLAAIKLPKNPGRAKGAGSGIRDYLELTNCKRAFTSAIIPWDESLGHHRDKNRWTNCTFQEASVNQLWMEFSRSRQLPQFIHQLRKLSCTV